MRKDVKTLGMGHSYKLTASQVRQLWHVKHTLSLVDADTVKVLSPELHKWAAVVKISALKLQELLYAVPHSDKCNPYRDEVVALECNTDMGALR